jgi:hypothetical protein
MALQLDNVSITGTIKVGTSTTAGYVLTASDTSGNAVWAADTAPTEVPTSEVATAASLTLTTLDSNNLVKGGFLNLTGLTTCALTLPAISANVGRKWMIMNTSSAVVTLTPTGTDLVGTAATLALAAGDRISIFGGTANSGGSSIYSWVIGV